MADFGGASKQLTQKTPRTAPYYPKEFQELNEKLVVAMSQQKRLPKFLKKILNNRAQKKYQKNGRKHDCYALAKSLTEVLLARHHKMKIDAPEFEAIIEPIFKIPKKSPYNPSLDIDKGLLKEKITNAGYREEIADSLIEIFDACKSEAPITTKMEQQWGERFLVLAKQKA